MRDLVIVGGGPAGATCAFHAAKYGLDVVLLEMRHFPRRKPCGGALSKRAAELLEFDIGGVIERNITSSIIQTSSGKSASITGDDVLGYTIRRETFDSLLIERAKEAGVEVIEGSQVVAVEQIRKGVRALVEGDSHKGRLLVGADGVNSIVAKRAGLQNHQPEDLALCIVAEVEMSETEVTSFMKGTEDDSTPLEVFLGILEGGYGWLFPKQSSVSIGIGHRMDYNADIRSAWASFTEKLEGERDVSLDLSNKMGGRIHMGSLKSRITARRTMLVGDAAGLASSITGEGLFYSIKSGITAAQVAKEVIEMRRPFHVAAYEYRLKEGIADELQATKYLSKFILKSETNAEIICDLISRDSQMAQLALEMIIGSRNATEIKNDLRKRVFRRHLLSAIRLAI